MEPEERQAEGGQMPAPPRIKVNRQLASVKAQVSSRPAHPEQIASAQPSSICSLFWSGKEAESPGSSVALAASFCCNTAWPISNNYCNQSCKR